MTLIRNTNSILPSVWEISPTSKKTCQHPSTNPQHIYKMGPLRSLLHGIKTPFSMAENKWITEIQSPYLRSLFFTLQKKNWLNGPIGWNVDRRLQTRWWVDQPTQLKRYATVKLGIISPSEEVTRKQYLKPPSSKVSSGSYWGWNGLHDTRCASTELLELASSNFRFIRLAGGMSLEPSLPRKRLEPRKLESHPWKCEFMKLIGELNMNEQKTSSKRNGQVQSYVAGFCCFIPKKNCFWSSGASKISNI